MFEYQTENYAGRILNRDTWGAHINLSNYTASVPKYPDWLNPLQKQEWRNRGLVVWDVTTRVVAHLYAIYALKILEAMRETDTWKTNGLTIGSPAYRMSISDSSDDQTENTSIERPEDGWVLINQVVLSSEQAEEILEFLAAEEDMLTMIVADEDRDVREAYSMVVDLLLESRKKKGKLKKSGMKAVLPQKKITPISLKGEYLTIPQMAEICNVPIKQIEKWIRSGGIEAIALPGAGKIVEMEKFTKFLNRQGKPNPTK